MRKLAIRSLRVRLAAVLVLSVAASLAVAVLMLQLYTRSSTQTLARARDQVTSACEDVRAAWRYYGSGWNGPAPAANDAQFRADLAAILATALDGDALIAGGVWQKEGGLLATWSAGTARLPASLVWQDAAAAAAQDGDAVRQVSAQGETVVAAACRLSGPVPKLVAWTARRLYAGSELTDMRLGLAVLLALIAGMTGVLSWLIASWSRHVGRIEAALAGYAAGGPRTSLPVLSETGEWELDRIVAALNTASTRLDAAQRESAVLAGRMATAERLAALVRVAAGMAHEIRNPIAAIRLRAENALAGDDERRRTALGTILAQVARLDRLTTELLAMTQRRAPEPLAADLERFLGQVMEDCTAAAARRQVSLRLDAPAGVAVFLDTAMIGRAAGNLVRNAIEAAPSGGHVTVAGSAAGGTLSISVADDGPGVSGGLRTQLFEPFVTGRADGTGLGLAIARELITSHGGTLELRDSAVGACFVIDLPGCGACP